MTRLYVAAGGGGDALAAAILHSVTAGTGESAVIATMAWDRLIVDPLAGPRGIDEFADLTRLGERTWQVTAQTRPRPPAGSALPRLAGDISAKLIILDPRDGARGLADQILDAIKVFGPKWVDIVDVGGDIVARGDEKGVRSPLADCLILAACADLPVDTTVLVAGPGIDGELPQDYVRGRMLRRGQHFLKLRPAGVVPYGRTLQWHPSEATTLWAAASAGARGVVEVRDGSVSLTITGTSANVYRSPHAAVFDAGMLVKALVRTTSMGAAEDVARRLCGFSEIDRERRKAEVLDRAMINPPPSMGVIHKRMAAVAERAWARGAHFVTFRRLAEGVGLWPGQYERFRADLIDRWPERCVAGLWSVGPADNCAAVTADPLGWSSARPTR